jgi:hypothetical protein
MVKFSEPPDFSEQPNGEATPTWTFSRVLILSIVLLGVIGFIGATREAAPQENTENKSALTSPSDSGDTLISCGWEGAPCFGPANHEETNTSSEVPEKPLIKVKASQIFKDFDANEARAIKKYADKRIQITGIVEGIQSTFNDKPIVSLKTPNMFLTVDINLVESDWSKAENYNKGQQKTFICESVDEMIGKPLLQDCIDYGS